MKRSVRNGIYRIPTRSSLKESSAVFPKRTTAEVCISTHMTVTIGNVRCCWSICRSMMPPFFGGTENGGCLDRLEKAIPPATTYIFGSLIGSSVHGVLIGSGRQSVIIDRHDPAVHRSFTI